MYNDFAEVYDRLQDADYEKFVDYYEGIFQRYGKEPKLVLDLACGTGNITIPMAKRGYDMIGIDLSCEMLNIAREKAFEEEQSILFLNQDMTEFELYGTVDAIVCALDGINYITDKEMLQKVFLLAANYLNPGGIMIFDINSEYKLSKILGDNTFVNEEQGIYYVWRNNYSPDTKICEFELNFFEEQEDGAYLRFDEFQEERAYSPEEIESVVQNAKLNVEGFFRPFSFKKYTETDERIFVVVTKQ